MSFFRGEEKRSADVEKFCILFILIIIYCHTFNQLFLYISKKRTAAETCRFNMFQLCCPFIMDIIYFKRNFSFLI